MKNTIGSFQVISEHSPLDAREQLIIKHEQPTLDDFQKIIHPYINLHINVFKNNTYSENNFLGTWRVTSIIKNQLNLLKINTVEKVNLSNNVPTKLSELTNDTDFVTKTDLQEAIKTESKEVIQTEVQNAVEEHVNTVVEEKVESTVKESIKNEVQTLIKEETQTVVSNQLDEFDPWQNF